MFHWLSRVKVSYRCFADFQGWMFHTAISLTLSFLPLFRWLSRVNVSYRYFSDFKGWMFHTAVSLIFKGECFLPLFHWFSRVTVSYRCFTDFQGWMFPTAVSLIFKGECFLPLFHWFSRWMFHTDAQLSGFVENLKISTLQREPQGRFLLSHAAATSIFFSFEDDIACYLMRTTGGGGGGGTHLHPHLHLHAVFVFRLGLQILGKVINVRGILIAY